MILNVVDPAQELGSPPGKNERDDTTAAAARYLPSFDNVGSVSASVSDWLCRLVTGLANSRRALYTDDDLRTSTIRRSGIATSIFLPHGLGPDARERLVVVPLERISAENRQTEAALLRKFDRLRPKIIGAMLDDLVGVLARRSALTQAAEHGELGQGLQRMGDYHLGLIALDQHIAKKEHGEARFAEAYAESVQRGLADAAEDDPLTAGVLDMLSKQPGHKWEGTAGALLKALALYRPDDPRAGWPHTAKGMGNEITRAEETLHAAGVTVQRPTKRGARLITLTKDNAGKEAGSAETGSDPAEPPNQQPAPDSAPASFCPSIADVFGEPAAV
jgi:hypothetical protein